MDCASALAAYEQALAIDDRHAELHYRVATCHRRVDRLEAARRHYRRASDLDPIPHGAPTRFNEILRKVADDHRALFVDVNAVLTRASGDSLVGDDLFTDFAHPNVRAHQLIAEAVALNLRGAGIPAPAGRWQRERYADRDPASLYAAEPWLRAMEPGNSVARSVLRHLRSLREHP
jgi:tetratricopeptide (TPR) repeat protein